VRLLAVCVVATVDVVTPRAAQHQPGTELAQAVGLDMATWWKPTADSYFRHVSKAVLLQAVAQFAPEYVNRLAKLKKADIASEAERLVEGTGWMPAVFETGHDTEPQEGAQGTANEADAPEEATKEEAAHALAA
jgi:ParB family chromosome partitioning protein